MSNIKIFIIAGEPSGDNLGSKLMNSLKIHNNISFYGVGGDKMIQSGLKSLFPIVDLSVMGFIEVLPKLPKIIYRIWQTLKYIKLIKPDAVITIDSPGFNFIIAKKIKKLGIKLIHYVAPTVWAYKPERAKKMAKIYDHLLVILPFECKYFVREGLDTHYIGHPIVEDYKLLNKNEITNNNSNEKSILILPGSRLREIETLLPIFIKSIELIKHKFSRVKLYIVTFDNFKYRITEMMKAYQVNFEIILEDKKNILPHIDAAIVKSGTISFEIAMAKIPMIIAYKVNRLSAYILSKFIKIKYFNLINIISDKMVIPELLQNDCTPSKIAAALVDIIENETHIKLQNENSYQVLKKLGLEDDIKPSDKAAKIILEHILIR